MLPTTDARQTEDLTFRAAPKKAGSKSDGPGFSRFVSGWEARNVTAESKAEAEALLAPSSACGCR